MIFNSAGHNIGGPKVDPGAVANGVREADLTVEFRDLVNKSLQQLNAKFLNDKDNETLAQYIARIKPGIGSVIFETHFNAAGPTATGVEVLIPFRHTNAEFDCAREIAAAIANTCGLALRGDKGVKTEMDSHHKTLAIMRLEGMNLLLEFCFITNKDDLQRYHANKVVAAKQVAAILKKYDDLYM